jgi:phage-related protein
VPGNDRPLKPLVWMGSSKKDLLRMPESVIAKVGARLKMASQLFRSSES